MAITAETVRMVIKSHSKRVVVQGWFAVTSQVQYRDTLDRACCEESFSRAGSILDLIHKSKAIFGLKFHRPDHVRSFSAEREIEIDTKAVPRLSLHPGAVASRKSRAIVFAAWPHGAAPGNPHRLAAMPLWSSSLCEGSSRRRCRRPGDSDADRRRAARRSLPRSEGSAISARSPHSRPPPRPGLSPARCHRRLRLHRSLRAFWPPVAARPPPPREDLGLGLLATGRATDSAASSLSRFPISLLTTDQFLLSIRNCPR
jgi:hypothetical protein